VGLIEFDKTDVVRHNLVQRIIEAYGEEAKWQMANGK